MSQPLPPSATDWWALFTLFIYIGTAAAAIVVGALLIFVAKRHRGNGTFESRSIVGLGKSRVREAVVLAVISIVLLFSLSVVSYRLTANIQFIPPVENSLVVGVNAFQWGFDFHYSNGVTSLGNCYVPAGTPVIFNVTSTDVMHNFGLPDFKLKIDAIPGRYNTLWAIMPQVTGADAVNYTIRCFELCGSGHTYMLGQLIVMQPQAFNQWLSSHANSGMNATSPSNSTSPTLTPSNSPLPSGAQRIGG
jgi:cytochrome c oxidase subunit II